MRLRPEWKQPVDRVSIWLAIGVTVILVCAIGMAVATDHNPAIPRPITGTIVAWVIGINAYRLLRYGRRALPHPHAIALAGFLLFAAGQLAGNAMAAWRWISNIGALFLLGGFLSQMVEFGRRRPYVPRAR